MRPARLGRLAGLLVAAVPLGLHAAGDADRVYDIRLEFGPLLGCLERLALLANVPIVDRTERVASAACSGGRLRVRYGRVGKPAQDRLPDPLR